MTKGGWRHTAEAKQKISASLTGRTGRKANAATKAKLKASLKKYWQRVKQLEAEANARAAA